MTPLKLTDDEMEAVYNACRPLHVADRDAFMQALADALRRRGEIGPGAVHRAIRDAQRRFSRPPEFSECERYAGRQDAAIPNSDRPEPGWQLPGPTGFAPMWCSAHGASAARYSGASRRRAR